MFSKLYVSILIITSSFILSIGQTPNPKIEKIEAPQAFAWSFDVDGSYLGVETQAVNKENFGKYGLHEVRGVAIGKVVENSPAAAAGLKAGDVIVRFNGEEVTSSGKLTRLIGEVDPDHQAKITVVRNGGEQEITATLAKRPLPKFENGNFDFKIAPFEKMVMPDMKALPQLKEMPEMKMMPQMKDMPDLKLMPKDGAPFMFSLPNGEGSGFSWQAGSGRQIGVGVMPLTKQLAEHYGVDAGLMINEVRENSAAAKAGLKAGDIIVEADGKAIKTDFDLIRTVNEKKDGDVMLTVVRDGSRQTITVTPEVSKDSGFLWQTGEGDFIAPPALMPGQPQGVRPATPAAPKTTPAPMTFVRPGHII